ncbi:MAG: hypothetical protein ACOCX4_02880, partial [Planctomycetota bacterium]
QTAAAVLVPLASLGADGPVGETLESRPVKFADRRRLQHRWWPRKKAAAAGADEHEAAPADIDAPDGDE